MKNESKRHHWIPLFLLRNFAYTHKKRERIWVTDLKRRECRRHDPRGTAFVNRLYGLRNTEGTALEPDSLEKQFALMETEFSRVIRELRASSSIPDGEDFTHLMGFLVMTVIRTPTWLNMMTETADRAGKLFANKLMGESGRNAWERTRQEFAESSGTDMADLPTFESAQESWANDKFILQTNKNFILTQMLALLMPLTKLLATRQWRILGGSGVKEQFILSDYPLLMAPNRPVPNSPYVTGFATPWVDLLLPLDPHTVLIGSHRPNYMEHPPGLSPEFVAKHNSWQLMQAQEFLFSSQKNICAEIGGEFRTLGWREVLEIKDRAGGARFRFD